MSAATTVQAVQTSRPMPYMTAETAAMSNFMSFPAPAHIFTAPGYNFNAAAGRRGDISPFSFIPPPSSAQIDIAAYSQGAGAHYVATPFEQK